MHIPTTRRTFLAAAALLAAAAARRRLRRTSRRCASRRCSPSRTSAPQMMQMFADEFAEDFAFEPYYGGTLFKQGTELVALQRGNLEMGNIAPQDISNQIPEWSILTSAYLFRDAEHLQTFFDSDLGAEMKALAEEKLGVHILGPTYFGTRQVGLKPDKKIATPADMAGHQAPHAGRRRLAVPRPGARRQPDPDGLRRGLYRPPDRRDRRAGQPAAERAEHEVLRGDVADRADLAPRRLRPAQVSSKVWNEMSPEQQERFQAAADEAMAWSEAEHLKQEAELAESFKEQGLEIYEPDVAAFREHAQKMYLDSDLAKSWPEGLIEKINAL